MNTPNKLTLLRIILVPIFMAFLLWKGCPHHYLIAFVIFSLASITDCIDGRLARKYHQITDFGKFMDPIADKLLVCGAMIALISLGKCSAWIVLLVLMREFMVSSIRMIAAANGGKVIAANIWGKIKTVTQMIALLVIMAANEVVAIGWFGNEALVDLIGSVLLWISTIATVISGAIYLKQNVKFVGQMK